MSITRRDALAAVVGCSLTAASAARADDKPAAKEPPKRNPVYSQLPDAIRKVFEDTFPNHRCIRLGSAGRKTQRCTGPRSSTPPTVGEPATNALAGSMSPHRSSTTWSWTPAERSSRKHSAQLTLGGCRRRSWPPTRSGTRGGSRASICGGRRRSLGEGPRLPGADHRERDQGVLGVVQGGRLRPDRRSGHRSVARTAVQPRPNQVLHLAASELRLAGHESEPRE